MRYVVRANALYAVHTEQLLAKARRAFLGSENVITLPDDTPALTTSILSADMPGVQRGDVRFHRYVMLDGQQAAVAEGFPNYAQEDDPDVNGWPLCRLPRANHVRIRMEGTEYLLIMHDGRHYTLKNLEGDTVMDITHRGLCGGWNLETKKEFAHPVVCGLYLFCRYLEKENEWMIV